MSKNNLLKLALEVLKKLPAGAIYSNTKKTNIYIYIYTHKHIHAYIYIYMYVPPLPLQHWRAAAANFMG